MAVIAGNNDRIAAGIEPGDDADMAAAPAAREHGNGADLWLGDPLAIGGKRFRRVRSGAGISDLGQHEIHEGRAPQPLAGGRIGAEIFARLGDQRRPAEHRLGAHRCHRHRRGDGIALIGPRAGGDRANDAPLRMMRGVAELARVPHLRGGAVRFGARRRLQSARRGTAHRRSVQRQQADAADHQHQSGLATHRVSQCFSRPPAIDRRQTPRITTIFRGLNGVD